ncbi:MAG: AI-2E family transporter [Planctomycetota bacterium]
MKTRKEERRFLNLTIEAAVHLAILVVLVVACLHVIRPFALLVIWGIIIAIATWPLFRRLMAALGGRQRLAAGLFTESVTEALVSAGKDLAAGDVTIPAPPEKVADWPLIGEKLESIWTEAAANPPAAVKSLAPQIKAIGSKLVSAVGGIAIGVLQFAVSIIVAGVFLATAKGGAHAADALAERLAGAERGRDLVKTAASTVSSVVKGVLAVAFVQAVAATLGLLLAGVPGAPVWGLLVLFLAIVQLPPIFVMGPMIFYVFSTTDTFGAVVFMIWAILVSVSDTFLKPLFLGRGVEVPMLVILIGAIGGMIAWGVLGLFVGAVVLAVGYQFGRAWFNAPPFASQTADESG